MFRFRISTRGYMHTPQDIYLELPGCPQHADSAECASDMAHDFAEYLRKYLGADTVSVEELEDPCLGAS